MLRELALVKYAFTVVTLLASSLFVAAAQEDVKLNEDRFLELMQTIVPVEKSTSIDWQVDLLAAQKVALEQSKPIFIWSMDGHPLGCT